MIEIEGVGVGGENPARLVAEISNNHNGSPSRAIKLVGAACRAGVDFVKFQAYTPDELVQLRGNGPAPEPWGSQGHSMASLYEMAKTPIDWLPVLFEVVRTNGAVPFASAFGTESLAALRDMGCPALKMAAIDMGNLNWMHTMAKAAQDWDVPLIGSFREAPSLHPFDLTLYCPEGYPQEHFDFAKLENMDGFSYHGTDWTVPAAAIELGASMVEFHFQMEDEPSTLEAGVSLNERDAALLVREANHDLFPDLPPELR